MLRSHSMVAGSTSSQSAASPSHLRPGHCNRKARAEGKRHMPLRINLQHCRYDIRAALSLDLSKHAPCVMHAKAGQMRVSELIWSVTHRARPAMAQRTPAWHAVKLSDALFLISTLTRRISAILQI
jgi:hypothetical protein